MQRFVRLSLFLIGVMILAACGGAPTASSSAVLGVGATATLPAATQTPTINPIPTQTRIAELSLIATLTAPTPTRVATPGGRDAVGQSFVGRLDRSDAFVSIVLDKQKVLAYVCDGAKMATWFSGDMVNGAIDLRAADGTRLTASVRADGNGTPQVASDGTVRTPDGVDRSFTTANTNMLDGSAGLYMSKSKVGDTQLTMGVIVLARGEHRGVLWANAVPNPISEPQYATGSLTATVANLGTFTAFRLTSPT